MTGRLLPGVAAVLVLAACGGDDAESVEEASDAAGVAASIESVATDSTAAVLAGDDSAAPQEPVETSSGQTSARSSYDPADLDPDTAVVVVGGREFRFERGDGMFDRCDLAPDIGLAGVEMDLAGGSAQGERHLVFNDDDSGRLLTIGIPPDTGFIAGAGEEIDRYLGQFDVDPPPLGAVEVGDDTAVGTTTMVDVFSGEAVEASFAIRCR